MAATRYRSSPDASLEVTLEDMHKLLAAFLRALRAGLTASPAAAVSPPTQATATAKICGR